MPLLRPACVLAEALPPAGRSLSRPNKATTVSTRQLLRAAWDCGGLSKCLATAVAEWTPKHWTRCSRLPLMTMKGPNQPSLGSLSLLMRQQDLP